MSGHKRKAEEAFARKIKPAKNGINDNRSSSLKQKAAALLEQRKKLPIWQSQDEIRQKASSYDVLLLVGETGSGKSTQVPQFLTNEKWCQQQRRKISGLKVRNGGTQPTDKEETSIGGCIAILQPRRVAATSLARRVADEQGTPLGSSSPASTVGYSVRFDNNCSANTKIKFLTDGMLLAELLRDPWLRDYSCVVVDEVHERGLNVDLCLGFLKRIVENQSENNGRGGVPLKIIIMSATAEMGVIEKFFAAEGETVSEHQEGEAWEGFSDTEDAPAVSAVVRPRAISVASIHIQGRQYPVTISYAPTAVTNLLDAALSQIISIHAHQPLPGDILVFLSGQEMIENLQSLAETYAQTLNTKTNTDHPPSKSSGSAKGDKVPSLQILPLYAALPTSQQQRIFSPTPPFTRRLILSTDIAETSVTIPNIRHVIDTGKHKSRHFRAGLNLDTLLSTPISRSSAAQRAGRAGREAAGYCYRLYTHHDFTQLDQDTPPEILQTDLSFLVLTLKAHSVSDVLSFPLLTPPPKKSLVVALERLLDLGALDAKSGEISHIGRRMSLLPLRVDLGRALIAAIDLQAQHSINVLDQVINIISALSLEEGIFLPLHTRTTVPSNLSGKKTQRDLLLKPDPTNSDSEEDANPIAAARRTLQVRHSDHLTLQRTIKAYLAPSTHDRRAWCDTHGVSHRAMLRISDIRKQLGKLAGEARMQPSARDAQGKAASPSDIQGKATSLRDSQGKATSLPDIQGKATSQNNATPLTDPETNDWTLKCLLTGLWPNTATLAAAAGTGAPYTTLLTKQGIHVHPSSIMFGGVVRAGAGGSAKKQKGGRVENSGLVGASAVMFTDLIFTKKAYARNVSAVQLRWLEELGVGSA